MSKKRCYLKGAGYYQKAPNRSDLAMELINVKQLSTMLNVKTKTIYDWIYDNRVKIPYYKLGKLVRFNIDEIMKWLKDKKATRPYNRTKTS